MSSTPEEEPPTIPPTAAAVAARVERAERRRGRLVKSLLLLGCLIFGAGLVSSAVATRAGQHSLSALVLSLLLIGLLIEFPASAIIALLAGPTWRQRQDHWRLLHWEAGYRAPLATKERCESVSVPTTERSAGSESGRL